MKKIFSLCVLLTIYSLANKGAAQQVFIDKINLNLKPSEIAITFLKQEQQRGIIIHGEHGPILIDLGLNEDDKFIKESLKLFNIKTIRYLFTKEELEIEGINITNYHNIEDANQIKFAITDNLSINFISENNIDLNYNDLVTIIVDDINKLNSGVISPKFLYLLGNKFNRIIKPVVYHKLQYVFYDDKSMNEELLEFFYSKWIDTYEIKNNTYPTLKLSQDGFDMISIPIAN